MLKIVHFAQSYFETLDFTGFSAHPFFEKMLFYNFLSKIEENVFPDYNFSRFCSAFCRLL